MRYNEWGFLKPWSAALYSVFHKCRWMTRCVLYFTVFFSPTSGPWAALSDPLEKKWPWSPLMTVTYPWQFASESRSAITPAPHRVPRLDRRSKRGPASPTFTFPFSLWAYQTNEGMCCTSGAAPNCLHYRKLHSSHSAILSGFYLLISALFRAASLLSTKNSSQHRL